MINKKNQIVLMFILAVVFISACKNNAVSPAEESSHRILFEVEYINFAWGYSHYGIYIDSAGSVHHYHYDFTDSDAVWTGDSARNYTEEELLSKYSHHDTLIRVINRDTLMQYQKLIDSAKSGTFSDTISIGADMGELSYIAYEYIPSLKKYHQIILRVEGDYAFYNQAESALKLASWLKRVNEMPIMDQRIYSR